MKIKNVLLIMQKHYYKILNRYINKNKQLLVFGKHFRYSKKIQRSHIFVFILLFLVLIGQPKFIFRTYFHIPWLTDVQLVQSLYCQSNKDRNNWPNSVAFNKNDSRYDSYLTIVIVTAQPEFKRLPLTLAGLACHLDSRRIFKVMFVTPSKDVRILEQFFTKYKINHWPWPVSIVPDDQLLKYIHTDSYRLQMMLKLVVAQIIQTEYYMILDSDCVAIWPIHVDQLLLPSNRIKTQNKISPLYRSLYQIEDRLDRLKWWVESEQLLQIQPNTCISNDLNSPTMGVTPIILSRTISLTTLCRLQTLYGENKFLNKLANWALWKVVFDRMWTEYTLYYLTGKCTKLFDNYHVNQKYLNSSNITFQLLNFYGLSVWWRTDWTSYTRSQLIELIENGLKWRQKEINRNDGRATFHKWTYTHYLFTVLQGRQYVNPNLYHKLFYPLFIEYLKKQSSREKLIKILDEMCDMLLK